MLGGRKRNSLVFFSLDTGSEDFFPAPPMGFHNKDDQYSPNIWTGKTLIESQPSAQPISMHTDCGGNNEHIYTELHKPIDWVISEVPLYTPLRLDEVREQNRKLIAKLKSLNGAITRDTTPTAVLNELAFLGYSSVGSESTSAASSPCASSVSGNARIPEKPETLQAVPDSCAPLIQDTHAGSIPHQTASPWRRRPSFAAVKYCSRLAN
ncbi:hypothetical protein EV356DRAFT_579786 [Viridothelium virens]|uniref:Uncharacterized protein n=1 Tax=Viridothelium virens TaxID=1048519 RepID=A0A6A6GYV9_VIRVR|nr:hypothetical protein EV356DRAFT_579786 [Viridothelium virens]